MHAKRIVVASILLPLLYALIRYAPPMYFFVLISVMTFIALAEFLSMYGVCGKLLYVFPAVSMFPLYLTFRHKMIPVDLTLAIVAVVMIVRLLLKKNADNALKDVSPYIVGFLYIPLMLGYFISLHHMGSEYVLLLILVVWGADSAALYIGGFWGKRKLYEAISPKKTVEGAIAAIFGGAASATILKPVFHLTLTYEKLILTGIILSVVGIVGDLVESMFKRDAGVKDSGTLLPGHGGILDKIDGMLFTAPVLYHIIKAFTDTKL